MAITIVDKGEAEMKYNIEKKRKTNKDMDYNDSSRQFRPLGSRVTRPSHVKNEFSPMRLTACQCENGQSEREGVQKH